jgi:hypothetical protein
MDCRFCQHYHFEGHRQGECVLFEVPVDGYGKMCCLAIPPFVTPLSLPLQLKHRSSEFESICLCYNPEIGREISEKTWET